MHTLQDIFKKKLAQTSREPLLIEPERAKGVYIWDKQGKRYLDLISGIAVSNVGHAHPIIIEAVKEQLERYSYLMVYGEYVQAPQVQYAEKLAGALPSGLDQVYFTNSGSEATEGALKLAKKYTGRSEIIACKKAYHGNTTGALSLIDDAERTQNFRPLLPDIRFIEFNNLDTLEHITDKTAAVFIEPIQAEAGIILPDLHFLKALQEKCTATGALLVLDEAQTAFGRIGYLFALQYYDIAPDILLLAKALGGGFPLGAFISSESIMNSLSEKPVLGHITTFGGHAISCAAGMAQFDYLIREQDLLKKVREKGDFMHQQFSKAISNPVRGEGLFYTIEFKSAAENQAVINTCLERGIITDWFLFADNCLRIAPPLTISDEQLMKACAVIVEAINK